jgi:hypothetical protein
VTNLEVPIRLYTLGVALFAYYKGSDGFKLWLDKSGVILD